MQDLDRALSDISLIREQLAKSCEFQAFGCLSISASGLLAFIVAMLQPHVLHFSTEHLLGFIGLWVATAAVSVVMIGVEATSRAHRVHGSLALPMLQTAIEHFCPAMVAGALVTVIIIRRAPSSAWMLPGLWEVIFSLGAFATARLLPRPMVLVGVWYLVCGLVSLQVGQTESLMAWLMGIPFGVGQLAVAGILYAQQRPTKTDEHF